MKKYLLIVTLVLITLLSACKEGTTEPVYTLNISANIESATPTNTLGAIVKNRQSYTITAPEIDGYNFLYWQQLNTTTVVSFTASFDYVLTSNISFEAIYESLTGTIPSDVFNLTYDSTSSYLTMDLSTYYDNAEGLYGLDLFNALHTIINNGFNGVTYGDARYILDDTDEDPNNINNIILIYRATSVSEEWDQGNTWNREHVWPQSKLGDSADNGTVNIASDLYNLMPSNPSENSSRGNHPYSELGLGYEPRDEVKGDIARALFYMMVMYDELNLVNTSPGLHEMGYLNELLQWSIDDPVDDFELNRLEIIYSEQQNRNPFVDYPHLVELVFAN